jgi:hypothetical protein
LTTPSKHYGIEVFPYQDIGEEVQREDKELKAKQGVEREDKELKSKEEDQEKRAQVKKMKVFDLMT